MVMGGRQIHAHLSRISALRFCTGICALKSPIIQAIHPRPNRIMPVLELVEMLRSASRWYKAVAVVTDIQQLELAERFLASSITSWAVPRQCDRHGMPCSENACRCRLFSGRPAASVSRRRLHRSSTSVSCGNAKSPIPPMRAPGGIISPSFASRRVRGHQRQTIRWPSNSGYSARELPMPRRKPSCWNMPMHAFARIRLKLPAEQELQRIVRAALHGFFHDLYTRVTASSRKRRGHSLISSWWWRLAYSRPFDQLKTEPSAPGVKNLQKEVTKLHTLRALGVSAESLARSPDQSPAALETTSPPGARQRDAGPSRPDPVCPAGLFYSCSHDGRDR